MPDESCLGSEHAHAALAQQVSCAHCHCARLPLADRQQRADALATAAEEDDWPVLLHGPALSSWIRVLGRWFPHPVSPRTEETEMEPGAGLARLRDPRSLFPTSRLCRRYAGSCRNCRRSSKRQLPGEVSSFPRLRRALLPVAAVFLQGTDRQE